METAEQLVIESPEASLEQPTQSEANAERPRHAPREPLFNDEQQKAFTKAWSKRERKLHAAYAGVLRDLFETVDIAKQLLTRCTDRLSVEDQVAILDGFEGIRRDWEKKWQKRR